jgi:hypothetical protein
MNPVLGGSLVGRDSLAEARLIVASLPCFSHHVYFFEIQTCESTYEKRVNDIFTKDVIR